MYPINTMLCNIKVNSYIIELTVHNSSKCVLVLLCVKLRLQKVHLIFISSYWTLCGVLLLVENKPGYLHECAAF